MNKKYFESFYFDFSKKSVIKPTKDGTFIETITIKCVPIEAQKYLKEIAEQDEKYESMIEDANETVFSSAIIFSCNLIAYAVLLLLNHA